MGSPASFATLSLLAALCALFGAGCTGPTVGGGEAQCAAPASKIEASPARAVPNEAFDLHGEGFFDDFVCNDTGPPWERDEDPLRGLPTGGIRIEFAQGAKTWPLTTIGSDANLSFDAKGLRVPAGAGPGRATVRVTGGPWGSAQTPFLVLGKDGEDAVSGNWEGYVTTERQGDIESSLGFELDLKRSGSDVSGTMTLPSGTGAAPVRLAVVSGSLRGDRLAFSARNAEAGARVDFEGTVGSGRMEGAAGLGGGSGDGRGSEATSMGGTLKAEKSRDVVPGDW